MDGVVISSIAMEGVRAPVFLRSGNRDRGLTPLVAGSLRRDGVPEPIEKYPEATMFGELPAFGFFVRHVDGLVLRNIRIYQTKPDARPPFVFDDVKNLDR